MNCTDFECAAQARLDERCSMLSPELRDHAVQCPACRDFWQEQLTLLAASRSWPPVVPPSGLLSGVLATLSRSVGVESNLRQSIVTPPVPHRVSRGSLWAALCSTAALLLLTLTLTQFSPPGEPNGTRAMVDAASGASHPESSLGSQTLADLWNGVHSEYQGFSLETTRVLDQIGELPEAATLLPTLPVSEPSSTQPSPAWLRLTRPVSERVGQAFDFLRDAVPGETPQSS